MIKLLKIGTLDEFKVKITTELNIHEQIVSFNQHFKEIKLEIIEKKPKLDLFSLHEKYQHKVEKKTYDQIITENSEMYQKDEGKLDI